MATSNLDAVLAQLFGGAPTNQNTYNVNPDPTSGQGVFGMVPGPVGLPNPYQDLSGVFPGLGQTNAALSGDIQSELGGQLSAGTQKMMQDAAAAQAIRGGMPGSNALSGTLFGNRSLRDLGLASEQQVQRGIQNYNQTIPTVSNTQTVNPALQMELAMWNAINRSAPDPTKAGNYAQWLFNQYLQGMRNSGSGRGPQAGGGGQGGLDPVFQMMLAGDQQYAPGGGSTPRYGGFPDPSQMPYNQPTGTGSVGDAGWYDPNMGLGYDASLGLMYPGQDYGLMTSDTGGYYDPFLGE